MAVITIETFEYKGVRIEIFERSDRFVQDYGYRRSDNIWGVGFKNSADAKRQAKKGIED